MATYRPPLPHLALLVIDTATGRVRRYVRVLAAAGTRPRPVMVSEYVPEEWNNGLSYDKDSVEKSRKEGWQA